MHLSSHRNSVLLLPKKKEKRKKKKDAKENLQLHFALQKANKTDDETVIRYLEKNVPNTEIE